MENDLEIKTAETPLMFHVEPYPINLVFHGDDGDVGKFEYDREKKCWTFEGDADESAKLFVKFVMAHFQSAMDADRDGLLADERSDT